jgi:transposase-like protein
VIVLAVRWYLRFGLSYRDIEELLAERGIEVDHTTIYRWVQRFTPLLADAARPRRHAIGARWEVDETYVKVAGVWRYINRAVDQYGQVIDVFVSPRRDATAARRFFDHAIATTRTRPTEVVTDRAATYPIVLDEVLPGAWHRTERYANNHIEADHGRLKARLRPMRGLKQDRSARSCSPGMRSCRTSAEVLRAGGGGTCESSVGGRVRRARYGDLIGGGGRGFSPPRDDQLQQRRSAWEPWRRGQRDQLRVSRRKVRTVLLNASGASMLQT